MYQSWMLKGVKLHKKNQERTGWEFTTNLKPHSVHFDSYVEKNAILFGYVNIFLFVRAHTLLY